MNVGMEWSFQWNGHYHVWFAKRHRNDHYLRNHHSFIQRNGHSIGEAEESPFHSFITLCRDQNNLTKIRLPAVVLDKNRSPAIVSSHLSSLSAPLPPLVSSQLVVLPTASSPAIVFHRTGICSGRHPKEVQGRAPARRDHHRHSLTFAAGMDKFEAMDNNEKGPGKNKRKWTDAEDRELVYALFDLVNAGTHKADNGFKPGFLGVIEAVLKQKLPGSGIKAKPHIDSRIKTMKKDFRVVYDMLNGENCSGFGWDPHKNVVVAEDEVWNAYVKTHKGAGQWRSRSFPHYEMFCTIFGKDRATGKGASTTEDVLDELTRTEENEDTQNLGMDFVEMEHSTASTNNEGTSKKGKRKRSSDNMDGFREAAMIIANKIDEATEKFSRAIGVDLDIANKRDKINEELRKLPNLSRAERHKALISIGCDNEMTALFFTLEDDEKEDFVRALLSGGL